MTTTPANPRGPGRPARYTPEELQRVVVQEFISRGYDATSMEDLARATGLTKSSFYYHFSSKEELLRLAVTRAVDALFAVLDEPACGEGPAIERLEHAVRRSAQVLVELLPNVTLLLRVRGNTDTERWALTKRREFDQQLAALVQNAIDEGDVRADLDPHLVTRLLFGLVNSVVEWFRPSGAHSADELAEGIVALAFDGLRSR